MTFFEIMEVLSKMYGTYDATCWLNKPRKEFNGKNAGDILREGRVDKIEELIKKESKYKKIKQNA